MSKYPLTKFTIIFIAGIGSQYFYRCETLHLLIISWLLLGIIIILRILEIDRQILQTGLISILILLFGATYFSVYTNHPTKYLFDQPVYKKAELVGSVYNIELIRERRISFQVSTDTIFTKNKKFIGVFNIIVSVYDSPNQLKKLYNYLKVGNKIKIQCALQRPRNQRNPFEFNYEKYLNERGIVALASCYDVNKLKIINGSINFFGNSVFSIRKWLDQIIYNTHNRTTASMLRGLILADRSSIDSQINQDFINSGVVHVLSVSGLHVGYIVLIFLFLFGRMNLYWRISLTIIGLFFYMIITGSEAPVFRSTLMVSIVLLTPIFGRNTNGYNTLSLAALILLLLNPKELFNPSFQLSFSAILSLIILFPSVKCYVDNKKVKLKVVKYLLMFVGSTLAAQIGTLPFTLVYFSRISLTSIIANIFVIPISGMIVGLGIVSIILFHFSVWMAIVFGSCNEFLTYLMLWLVKVFGNPNYSILSISQFSLYDSVIFYIMLGLIIACYRYFISLRSKIVFITLVVLCFIIYSKLDNSELLPKNKLSILAIDVGQGESILVKFPNDKVALIDAGNANEKFDNGKRIIEPLLEKLGIEKIDYGFVSHVDSDHYAGFLSLVNDGVVKQIYKPTIDTTETKDINFEKLLHRLKVPINYYKKCIIPIGDCRLYVLNYHTNKSGKLSSNDKSGMFKLVYGTSSLLFTGDASANIEKEYVQKYGSFLKATVLKVGHHGSKTSTSEIFLTQVKPKFAIISVGIMNKFKHPSQQVLDKLNLHNVEILRTDLNGAILLQSNGTELNPINWKN